MLWAASDRGKPSAIHGVVCITVDRKGRPLDPIIFQVKQEQIAVVPYEECTLKLKS